MAMTSVSALKPVSLPHTHGGFPAVKGVRWFNLLVLTITPAIAGYGLIYARRQRETLLFSAAYYVFSMLGKKTSPTQCHIC